MLFEQFPEYPSGCVLTLSRSYAVSLDIGSTNLLIPIAGISKKLNCESYFTPISIVIIIIIIKQDGE